MGHKISYQYTLLTISSHTALNLWYSGIPPVHQALWGYLWNCVSGAYSFRPEAIIATQFSSPSSHIALGLGLSGSSLLSIWMVLVQLFPYIESPGTGWQVTCSARSSHINVLAAGTKLKQSWWYGHCSAPPGISVYCDWGNMGRAGLWGQLCSWSHQISFEWTWDSKAFLLLSLDALVQAAGCCFPL